MRLEEEVAQLREENQALGEALEQARDQLSQAQGGLQVALERIQGLHQRCWVHFLRDVHDLKEDFPHDLERQVEHLKTYAASKGYQVSKEVTEIASGMNDNRPKLLKILTDKSIGVIVVEHQDRLTRFGANYIEQLMQMQGRRIEVMFPSDTNHDLVDDFIAVITSMASRIYGRRHSKERAEKIKACVEQVMSKEEVSQ